MVCSPPELHEDMICKRNDAKETYEEEIRIYNQKIAYSRGYWNQPCRDVPDLTRIILSMAASIKEKYEELAQKQNDIIKVEKGNIRKYENCND